MGLKGREIFERYREEGGDYARTLGMILLNIGDDLFPLLEAAEKEGKRIKINIPDDQLWDELTAEDLVMV